MVIENVNLEGLSGFLRENPQFSVSARLNIPRV